MCKLRVSCYSIVGASPPEHFLHILHYFLKYFSMRRLKVTGSMVLLVEMMGKGKKLVMGIVKPVNMLDATDMLPTEHWKYHAIWNFKRS